MVLVGATIVGSMATVWHGVVNPPRRPTVEKHAYAAGAVRLGKGEEMGRFLLGSTVVMLFPRGVLRFRSDWASGAAVRMGEPMAHGQAIDAVPEVPCDGAADAADAP
jgi:phosphatidylserine decarboxylase